MRLVVTRNHCRLLTPTALTMFTKTLLCILMTISKDRPDSALDEIRLTEH